MARIVKPNLQNHSGTVKIKNYTYKGDASASKINAVPIAKIKPFSYSELNTKKNKEGQIINVELVDVFNQNNGNVNSYLSQFHIFDQDTTEEVTPSQAPDIAPPELKKEEQNKEEKKEESKEEPKEEKKEEQKKEEKKTDSSKPYGDLDMTNYPGGQYDRAAQKERSVLVAKYLVNEGGFTKEQAAAMVGVFWDENGTYPGEVMQAEKRANVNSYGAGIASWTDQTEKNKVLRDAGLPAGTPIESLTLQQQCDMLIASSNGTYKTYYNALKRCDTLEDASATAVCITGGVGFSNNWSTHPTQADAHRLSEWYGTRNDNKYGYSSYHHNLDSRRLQLAREIYAEL